MELEIAEHFAQLEKVKETLSKEHSDLDQKCGQLVLKVRILHHEARLF